jgi:hypothetical protein
VLFAAGMLVPVLAQPAAACIGGHGQVFLSGFAGGDPPTNVPTIFYAGTEGATATATIKPTLSCVDQSEIGRVRAHYVTETTGSSTATAGDFTDTDGMSSVLCEPIHDPGFPNACDPEPSEHQVPVPLVNDDVVENLAVEWFQFRLTQGEPVSPGNALGGLATPSQARMYVIDNDGGFRPAMEPGAEGRTHDKFESGLIRIPVFRAGSLANVSFTVTGTGPAPATNGVDFTCTPSCSGVGGAGTLATFEPSNPRLGFIQVSIISDGSPEGSEVFRVSVTGAAAADDDFTTVRIPGTGADTSDPVSRFHHPKDGLKYLRGDIRIREMHSITRDIGIAGLARVQIAVRQKLMNGSCRWWNGNIFAVRPCADRPWLDMAFVGEWSTAEDIYGRNFPALTPSVNTKIRNYTAWTRAIDAAGNEESVFQRGRNYSVFEVLRKRRR